MRHVYVILSGLLFAVLQSAYFFVLEIRLTAAYPSFLAVTLGWLLGSVAGLRWGSQLAEGVWIGLSLLAFFSTQGLLHSFPYATWMLPVAALMIAVSGAQAGAFFRQNRDLMKSASRLFFWENNGFIAGWILGFACFVQLGPVYLVTGPAAMALTVGLCGAQCRRSSRAGLPVEK
jgi:hypothetical protein